MSFLLRWFGYAIANTLFALFVFPLVFGLLGVLPAYFIGGEEEVNRVIENILGLDTLFVLFAVAAFSGIMVGLGFALGWKPKKGGWGF